MNIIIIGYYQHKNIGDEQYKITFEYLIKYILHIENYTLTFIDCDTLKLNNVLINDNDIIIVGGGDVLNNYFLDTIIDFFKTKQNKLYSISTGIPYTDILNSPKLEIFSKIFLRSTKDIITLQKKFPKIEVHYIPDLSYLLLKYENEHIKQSIIKSY